MEENWQKVLAEDYLHPHYHVSLMIAIGRRIRRNYLWILLIQSLAFGVKLSVHPTSVENFAQAVDRADVGPIPGEALIVIGVFYILCWSVIAIWSYRADGQRASSRGSEKSESMG